MNFSPHYNLIQAIKIIYYKLDTNNKSMYKINNTYSNDYNMINQFVSINYVIKIKIQYKVTYIFQMMI